MKKQKMIKNGLAALALTLALPAAGAPAQELNSLYVTPRLIYSHQVGDMSPAYWRDGVFSAGVLGGEETDNNFGFGLSLGNDFSYSTDWPLRVELEYVYRGEGEFGKGPSVFAQNGDVYAASQSFRVKAHSLMGNVFYDFPAELPLTPYIGAGLGLAYLKSSYGSSSRLNNDPTITVASSKNDWNFAWNLAAGVSYEVTDRAALDFGYRYVDLGSAEPGSVSTATYSGSPKLDYTAHEFSVGLRFSGF
ncbi:MAG: outer membrane beta-barrel protein [Candidatus Adiutrix sp.]|jgi:opacity protein-like surface antigen|nr:outer membrane beta-barrel protein [Candidatus Adiutrix sp.]